MQKKESYKQNNLKTDKVILVTGSEGFIGRSLVKELKKIYTTIICIDKQLKHDVTDSGSTNKIPEFDLVYHLAAIASVPMSFENPETVYNVNVLGTLNILELCRKYNAKMIFISSYVYGQPKYLPIDESHPVNPTNPYAASKVIAEELCRSYSRDFGVKCVIVRPSNVYGYGQDKNMLIPTIIFQLAEKKEITLNDPAPRRDYICVDDAVSALVKLSSFIFSAQANSLEVFNLGLGKSFSVEEIVGYLNEENSPVRFTGNKRTNEIQDCYYSTNKIQKCVDWKPKNTIKAGLKKIRQEYSM